MDNMNLSDFSTKELRDIVNALDTEKVKELTDKLKDEINKRDYNAKLNEYTKYVGNSYVKEDKTPQGATTKITYDIVSYDREKKMYLADVTTVYENSEKTDTLENYVYSKRKETGKYVNPDDIKNCKKVDKFNNDTFRINNNYYYDYPFNPYDVIKFFKY